jgi:hypothetical protein
MSDQWTKEIYPTVPPNDKFRQDLQRALEQTHRQQIAQRKLGTHPARRQDQARTVQRIAGILLLLFALLITFRRLRRRATQP